MPEDYIGVVTQLLALRKGRMQQMVNHGTGWARMEYLVPARGLIGFRTEFLTETRGAGIMHHVFERYEPWHGELRTRPSGSLVADRRGPTTAFALSNLQERGVLFVAPGVEVYEGMVVGENARSEDMDVNACKEKKLTNMRASSSRRARPADPAAADLARAGARVHPRRRVRRGDAEVDPPAQGRVLGLEAPVGDLAAQAGARRRCSVAAVGFSLAPPRRRARRFDHPVGWNRPSKQFEEVEDVPAEGKDHSCH